ncbi:TIGR02301 family protein [Hyphomonas sp.]|uniref:TIGR02301 family protein n=1 Tax=Hyphomonas sp. TaxID=87 RepID=UPI00391C0DE7
MKKKRFHTVLISGGLILAASLLPALPQGELPTRGPDYFRDATDLAGILGSAHAIRVRCNGNEDQYWRRYMTDMLGHEAPEPGQLRSSLVSRFNQSYQRAETLYPVCDGTAVEAEARFAVSGQELAGRLAAHYFPRGARQGGGQSQ